jgi:hypothetical protein
MLQATRSFITLYDGEEVRIHAGRSRVAAGHPIVTSNPDSFQEIPGQPRGSRERTIAGHSGSATMTTPAPPADLRRDLGIEPWRISEQSRATRLSYAAGATRIRLAASARREILRIISETTAVDGLEIGGTLSGPPLARNGTVMELLTAYPTGPACKRSRSGFTPDVEHDIQLADRVCQESGGAEVLQAGWHTHPQGSREASGEGGDLQAWNALRTEVLDVDRYAGLIVVPTSDGEWQFTGFVLGAGHRQDVAQRAQLS